MATEIKKKSIYADDLSAKQIEVLENLTNEVKDHAYIVGAWIWVEFPEKPKQEIINEVKANEFRWNNDRKLWQNNCGCRVTRNNPEIDPRDKYGITPIIPVIQEKQINLF